jgi:hypothetical protein
MVNTCNWAHTRQLYAHLETQREVLKLLRELGDAFQDVASVRGIWVFDNAARKEREA